MASDRVSILSVSSGRADLAGLGAVWRHAARHNAISLTIALTGKHVECGPDFEAAQRVLPPNVPVHVVGADISKGATAAGQAIGQIVGDLSAVIDDINPDILLVLGDRLDLLPAVVASLPFNVPIAHLHGGELTYGAIDDRLRHAITKLAHLHFTSGTDAAQRICRMGEEPWRIQVVGSPGLDALSEEPALERSEFLSRVGLSDKEPFILVTVHPETNSAEPLAPFHAVLSALDRADIPALVTAANADAGGVEINARFREFARQHPKVVVRDTLGSQLYPNALRHAAAILGNSSSGVIEAGLFGLPSVNVGTRQDGRPSGENVKTVANSAEAIVDAVRAAVGQRYDPASVSLYGDAASAARVVTVLADLPSRAELLGKRFFSGPAFFSAPWNPAASAALPKSRTPETSGVLATRSRISADLRALGIAGGDIVCAHTALASIGFVPGGARTVIEALLEAIGEDGTLVMPSFSGDLSDPAAWRFPPVPDDWIGPIRDEMPAYDPVRTPSRGVGSVAELFRCWPGARRSAHPQSSFSAVGPNAQNIVQGHSLNERFGRHSPLARLEQLGGKVVLLGAPWDTTSIFYLTQFDVPSLLSVEKASPVVVDGKKTWATYSDVEYTSHWFAAGVRHLIDSGLAVRGEVGNAVTVVFEIVPALAEIRHWRKDRQL